MPDSLWLREAAPIANAAATPPAACDVVVIGGGIAGISTALWLARAGASVVVLERGRIAERASGRNDGQMLLGLGEHYNRIVGQFGRAAARRLWGFIHDNNAALKREIAAAGIACDLRSAGGLRLAETEHENVELHEAAVLLREDGIDHRLLDADEVEQELPLGVGFHGALVLPGEALVQPVAMVRGLAELAQAAGAMLAEQAPVVSIEDEVGEFVVRVESGAAVRAPIVVHCTSVLAPGLDRSGFLARRLFPFRGQVIATERLPDALVAALPPYAMSSNFCYEYFRVHDGRFLIGGMRWSVPGEESGITDDSGHNPAVTRNLLGYVRRHFPALAEAVFPHVWTGIMAGTDDGLPLLGALPGAPGVFALLGFNGYGLSFAFEAGRALAQQIIDGKAEHEAVAMFAPRRFAT